MRALLISANTEQINMPILPLGLACVAEATRRAGHEVRLLDLMGTSDAGRAVKKAIVAFQPHVIGISVRNIDDQNMANPRFLLDQAKGVVEDCRTLSEVPVILGGAGYSIFPDSVLEYLGADMGIQGEGEAAFPVLLEHIERKRSISAMANLYLRGRGLQGGRSFSRDLDGFPLPDPDLFSGSLHEGDDLWMPIQTRRGCPMRCSYCSTKAIEGCLTRKRTPETVVKWLAQWVERGFHRFQFVDNTFNLPPSYARAICSQIVRTGLSMNWRCILYPWKVDENLVQMMARAGCKAVSLGFESGSVRILKKMNKRFDPKQIHRVSKMLADHGIARMGFLMLGGPGETRESVEESLSFADNLGLEALKVVIGIRIYPHTKLAGIAAEEGTIAKNDPLLFPRFYMVKGLEDWLRMKAGDWMEGHPHWHA